MAQILLKAGKIFDGENFFDGDLLIKDGEISKIGRVSNSQATVVDVSGCIISSGLIDIHTHLLEMGNKKYGFPADMATIPFGVLYAVDACAEDLGLNCLDNLCVQTLAFIPIEVQNETLNYDKMLKRFESYGKRAIGVKVYFDDSLKNGITKEHLYLACKFAREKNLKVMVHCSYSPTSLLEIVEVLSAGDIITHAYHGGYNTIDKNDYIAYKKAKEKGVIIDAGMAGGVHTDFKILRNAIEKGYIPDVISTDITCFSAYIRGGIYGLPMCMSILKTLGMDEKKIFQAVTVNAAKSVDSLNWAQMKVGVIANLTVLKYDNTPIDIEDRNKNRVVSKNGYVCKLTVKNGQIIYRN